MKRRDFLRTIATGSAAVLAPTASVVASSTSTPRVGLLLPHQPDLEQQFRRGWQSVAGVPAAQIERVGPGTETATRIVKSWLEQGRVDLIVSALSGHGPQVRDLLEIRGVPMLVADYGANWARSSGALVVRQGLRMAEGAYALGRQAAHSGSRTAVMVTSAFDAGFDHPSAFAIGFESAGGRVLDRLLLDSSAVPWNQQRIVELSADAVYIAVSEAPALSHLRVPAGTRVLGGGLTPWLLSGVQMETALALPSATHPSFQLGQHAARTVSATLEAARSGLHLLPALLQSQRQLELQKLFVHNGQVTQRQSLPEPQGFEQGVQLLRASRASGYTNAYPLL